VRTCSAGVFKRARQIGRPCLLGYIGKCSAPCVERVNAAEHRLLAEDFCDFMAGNTTMFLRRLERQMQEAAAAEEFERAARLRDDIQALQRALEKQAVVLGDGTDCDVIALAQDQLEAAVQVFYVRGGRVRGQRGWVVDKVEDVSTGELVEHFLGQVYGDDPAAADAAPIWEADPGAGAEPAGAPDPGLGSGRPASAEKARRGHSIPRASNGPARGNDPAAWSGASVPREVLVPVLPPDAEAMGEWLAARRGSRVDLRVPRRGDKKALLGVVTRNAAESLMLHKTRRASDLTTRSRALNEIQESLGLDEAPLRIECYDVSNLQSSHVVASMVVFEDGLARKGEYRRFSVRQADGQGDVAAIHEVISRRFRRYLEEREETGELDALGQAVSQPAEQESRQRRFAYPPGLVVVDGGPAQAAAAQQALDELGIEDVAVCGLAKRLEEVWLPGDDAPVILPRTSEGLYLLQRVRDEAHRFAITYHRAKRSKALTESELDDVPGLGPARRKALLRRFGSVRGIREATVDEIAELPGFGPRTAQAVFAALGGLARSDTGGMAIPDGKADDQRDGRGARTGS
jgi:excinuclease ABC subunit C